jgi:hypothetical protein
LRFYSFISLVQLFSHLVDLLQALLLFLAHCCLSLTDLRLQLLALTLHELETVKLCLMLLFLVLQLALEQQHFILLFADLPFVPLLLLIKRLAEVVDLLGQLFYLFSLMLVENRSMHWTCSRLIMGNRVVRRFLAAA